MRLGHSVGTDRQLVHYPIHSIPYHRGVQYRENYDMLEEQALWPVQFTEPVCTSFRTENESFRTLQTVRWCKPRRDVATSLVALLLHEDFRCFFLVSAAVFAAPKWSKAMRRVSRYLSACEHEVTPYINCTSKNDKTVGLLLSVGFP